MRQTQEVAVDSQKLNELDSLFHSINDIGHAVQSLTAAARQAAAGAADKLKSVVETAHHADSTSERRTKNMISAISDGMTSSIRIWNKVRVK